MAVGEKRSTWVISQVSWTDWTAQDVYYWQEHSFQYSANINCDDELHGIKLSQKAVKLNDCAWCQLVSAWKNGVFALPMEWGTVKLIKYDVEYGTRTITNAGTILQSQRKRIPWTVFQDYFWYWENKDTTWAFYRINVTWAGGTTAVIAYDHPDYTDESIMDPTNIGANMEWAMSAILNYNNTRLVVACGTSIWVYYPELERLYNATHTTPATPWTVGWKKVLEFEAWTTIVALTCTFEYLKVWAVDEWWNTKVYYYQGNNNLRSTFVYNVVDLTGVRVTNVYSINWIDYYVSSQDWTDWYVNLYKMVGNTPVNLFHQRWWLDPLDVNFKAPYFVWPCGIDAGYTDWTFYIADTYGLFRFKYTPQWYDKGYMKWWLYNSPHQPYGVCFNQWFLYVSYEDNCYAMRAYDTWVDWFQSEWVLISREYEGKEWGTLTKMLDEIRLNYELNPLTNNKWSIDIYVSPNNLWKNTHTFTEANNWYHVMHIDNTNWATRTEKSNLFNDLGTWDASSFKFDWQTITYAIVINQDTSTHATPIVRQIDIRYHTKDKVNNVYDIN